MGKFAALSGTTRPVKHTRSFTQNAHVHKHAPTSFSDLARRKRANVNSHATRKKELFSHVVLIFKSVQLEWR